MRYAHRRTGPTGPQPLDAAHRHLDSDGDALWRAFLSVVRALKSSDPNLASAPVDLGCHCRMPLMNASTSHQKTRLSHFSIWSRSLAGVGRSSRRSGQEQRPAMSKQLRLSGLAARIRGCTTDETFDLAGQDVSFFWRAPTIERDTPTYANLRQPTPTHRCVCVCSTHYCIPNSRPRAFFRR